MLALRNSGLGSSVLRKSAVIASLLAGAACEGSALGRSQVAEVTDYISSGSLRPHSEGARQPSSPLTVTKITFLLA
jgi:hypothetical protein